MATRLENLAEKLGYAPKMDVSKTFGPFGYPCIKYTRRSNVETSQIDSEIPGLEPVLNLYLGTILASQRLAIKPDSLSLEVMESKVKGAYQDVVVKGTVIDNSNPASPTEKGPFECVIKYGSGKTELEYTLRSKVKDVRILSAIAQCVVSRPVTTP
jgi:hypothetical protein